MATAVTPKGVEHVQTSLAAAPPTHVATAVTPKGVEHMFKVDGAKPPAAATGVATAVTPKGVEHHDTTVAYALTLVWRPQ